MPRAKETSVAYVFLYPQVSFIKFCPWYALQKFGHPWPGSGPTCQGYSRTSCVRVACQKQRSGFYGVSLWSLAHSCSEQSSFVSAYYRQGSLTRVCWTWNWLLVRKQDRQRTEMFLPLFLDRGRFVSSRENSRGLRLLPCATLVNWPSNSNWITSTHCPYYRSD